MLASLISTLNSLRDFVSRAFFLSAYIPTLVFLGANGLILFLWSWPFHLWFDDHFIEATAGEKAIVFAVMFFAVWLASFIVAALTAFWTRILEGASWWKWLRKAGIETHAKSLRSLSADITKSVETYAPIERAQKAWRERILAAKGAANHQAGYQPAIGDVLSKLNEIRERGDLISLGDLERMIATFEADLRHSSTADDWAEEVTLMIQYAEKRAMREHVRLKIIRDNEFGILEEVRPTRFGNVGLVAEGFARRVYNCNLVLIWSVLQRVAETDAKPAKTALDDCKMQLDFFVAFFWLSLALAVGWALVFAWDGLVLCSLIAAVAGPFLCWTLWYGAAVEQYRVLQSLIISALSGPLRFRVLKELRVELPRDIAEEREIWSAIDLALGHGRTAYNLRYQHPST